ncbi:phosphoribulokinase [Halocynthiibacter sp. C4]|uniref:phosphoribulokinase n=1 Tax=Halocynthiibacter sp. C4 TaxID=2992758 RepID=UPI00237A4A9B|nr:phosphoribulokinase [Halocynthiibacter sp. C4]MDE0591468.1 phosphoribulokinase [Halocynthiibacter sp. C4]
MAEAAVRYLNAQAASETPAAELVPMDGYHLDNRILKARGLLARKGAPETFDASGFCNAIRRLQSTEKELFFPLFDRQLDLSIANAIAIHQETPIIVVEGNYLLLNSDPWKSLANVYSATIFVSPTLEVLENRLIQRWIEHGFDSAAALKRAKMNDLPNAELVINNSVDADLTLSQNDH